MEFRVKEGQDKMSANSKLIDQKAVDKVLWEFVKALDKILPGAVEQVQQNGIGPDLAEWIGKGIARIVDAKAIGTEENGDTIHQALRAFIKECFKARIKAGLHAYFAEMTGDLLLKNRHEARIATLDEIATDLSALLEQWSKRKGISQIQLDDSVEPPPIAAQSG